MNNALEYADLLRLIEERSFAFRAAVDSAARLDVQVPTCPEWTLLDLAQHLGRVHRGWAGVVAAGPADAPPAGFESKGESPAPEEREAVLGWLAASSQQLLDALSEAGPDQGCWTWWEMSQSPQNSGAVARHQLQEVAVHTYDAQLTVGAPQPLPEKAALDGVDEFLFTCCSTPSAWPHEPASVDYRATEGRAWRLSLSAAGVRVARLSGTGAMPDTSTGEDADSADASARGTASELVLAMYNRLPVDSLQLDGDRDVFDLLVAWDPDA